MAFKVETGAGLEDANAYGSAADFTAYHDDRGRDTSGSTTGEIEAAIIRATDYMDRVWTFVGQRENAVQALEWPRIGAFFRDDGRLAGDVPREVVHACFEYAIRALDAELAPDGTYAASGGVVESKSSKLGPLSKSETLAQGGAPIVKRSYPIADTLLRELVINGMVVRRA